MVVQKMKRVLFSAAATGALFVGLGTTSALAVPVILNPQAPNTGCTLAPDPCSQISAVDPAFPATQSPFWFTSDLIVQSGIGAAGPVHAFEQGALLLQDFNGVAHGLRTNYNIYGLFQIAGDGHWGAGIQAGTFFLDDPATATLTFNLYANPQGQAFPTFAQATQSFNGLASADSDDFLLASLFFNGFNGTPNATFVGGTSVATSNAEDIRAALGLTPRSGTEGATGFWSNVVAPFVLNVGASASANNPGATETTISQYSVAGGSTNCPVAVPTCVGLRTHGDFGLLFGGSALASFGNGFLTYDLVSSVPEPSTLALFGMGLLGLGFAVGRRRQKA